MDNALIVETNKYQTAITEELLNSLPNEVKEELLDTINNIPFIKKLISPNRPYARDLPKDSQGKIIVDITNPHIIEDADYFRQPALHFMQHGCYTFLKPNSNPNSEYRKYWDKELDRCLNGYVRERDGEWVTGLLYWFLNYSPMMVNLIKEGSKKAIRTESFPFFFEGIYWRFHYLEQARNNGHHAIELAKRGAGKSYSLAAIMSRNLILGESEESRKRVITVLTAYQKEYLSDSKDGTLSKFKPCINFSFSHTPFPRLMLKNSPNEMAWQMGYKDEYGVERGSLNQVLAVSAKDDPEKLRGKRGWILFEEMGSFKGLLPLYDITRKSVEDGDYTFALMYLIGTAAEDESDFSSAKTLLYNPEGYNIQSIENVYDKPKQGKPTFGFFFPSYINRAGCYNKDGVSDVIKALIEILTFRYKAKYSADPKSVLRLIAEDPITPAEAIIKVKAAYFPTVALTERLAQLDADPHAFDDVYIGNLALTSNGIVEFKIGNDIPIRKYGVENSTVGALEIFEMPEKQANGNSFNLRYIIGHDPVDNDQAESTSLSSTFVLDLFTDRIVAEYTGRQAFAEDNYEIVRLLCLFYNAKCLYEAHPYSQMVPTPEGFRSWGDIKVGDKLFSPTKGEVTVTDIPVDEEMPIYKVTLSDGRVIEASGNHIWLVYKGTLRTPVEMTTEQMLKSKLKTKHNQSKFFIPEHNGVEYGHKDLPIDPYTMGLILSKGSIGGSHCTKNIIQISSSYEDMKFYSKNVPYSIKHIGNKGFSWHISIPNCKTIMSNYGLYNTDSRSKFIPKDYLMGNVVQRMELLKGLMDGDGYASYKGASIFITCSKRLAEDMLSLIRSLGIKSWLQTSREGVYRVAIASPYKVFKLPRKVVSQHTYAPYTRGNKASALLNKTAIKSIEYSHIERGKCVTVDSEDGLYLIGDYVVTHNCNKKGIYAYFSKMQCTHLLADTPEYLRDKQLIKYSSFGSNAHPYYEKVYTPEGLRTWGDIGIGDILFAPDGTTTKVIDVPIDKELDIYKITLRDGRTIEASSEHLWEVYKFTFKKKMLISTAEMMESGLLYNRKGGNECKFYIKRNLGGDFVSKPVPMNSYLLGLMLGDGTMANKHTSCGNKLYFTSSYNDMMEYMKYLHMNYKQLDDRHWSIDFPGWGNLVKKLGLACTKSRTKFIPDLYKYNSREVRLEVLRGLFDTDGTCPKSGSPVFTTTSEKLANDVLEVARSLGIIGNLRVSNNNYGKIFQVILYTEIPLFRLQRKLYRQGKNVNRVKSEYVGIVNIEYIGQSKSKCVTVDREDGLYLIGDFITTHNCKGVNASAAINNYANSLLRDWLLQPVPTIIKEDGEEKEVNIPRLYSLRNRALLEELISYTPELNVDRIRALGMVMLYRQEKIILYKDNLNAKAQEEASTSYLGNDSFFQRNYARSNMQ